MVQLCAACRYWHHGEIVRTEETGTPTRPLRSDAAANRERVLAAAAAAVKREGDKVPIATIAREAGVGVGTVYRHYPTRAALLAALTHRSFRLVLDHARAAADSAERAINSIGVFLEQTIHRRNDLILPLHGGPVLLDAETVALQAEIRAKLTEVLRRGQREGDIRADVTAIDIIITGALLSQPLPHVPDWDEIALRQAHIYLTGLATTSAPPLPEGVR